jgi:hypothetical protein
LGLGPEYDSDDTNNFSPPYECFIIGYATNADTVLPSRARDGQGEARWSASVPEEEWSYLNSTVAITVHFYMHAFVATTPF